MKYKLIAIAGTFDKLHKGHHYFISRAFKFGERVLIGLTSDTFVQEKFKVHSSKFKVNIIDFRERKRELEGFLKEKNLLRRAEIVEINDVYGPAAENTEIEALLVTADTHIGGLQVNQKRKTTGMEALKIIKVPLIKAQDKEKISSTRIRLGEIDRWGRVFSRLNIYGAQISPALRQRLKKPLGTLFEGDPQKTYKLARTLGMFLREYDRSLVIAVGDEVTSLLNRMAKTADISVVDFRIKRIKVFHKLSDLSFSPALLRARYGNKVMEINNPPGRMTHAMVSACQIAIKLLLKDARRRIIKVEGEEDLAGLPAILMAPLGSLILYGQPDEGVVAVEVTEKKKAEILRMIGAER